MSLSYDINYCFVILSDDYDKSELILGVSAFILVATNIIAKDRNLN